MACIVTRTPSSSSTTRTLALGAVAIRGWSSSRQTDGERGALTRPATNADVPAVIAHDAVRHPQAQTGSLLAIRLGGEERLEDVRHVLLGNTCAGVADDDVHG